MITFYILIGLGNVLGFTLADEEFRTWQERLFISVLLAIAWPWYLMSLLFFK